jgi:4-amino-4-deoxy-L-arabinose transferase-like glycosyltransferase
MVKRRLWLLLLIMLIAAALRLAGLTNVPPGLTHDEADHGQDAWGVVNGNRPIYFTVGFGREPLFDYATAGVMGITGPSFLAGRLTAVYFSLIMIAGTYAWASRAFGYRVALLTAAGMAVSFYAVMTGRQALRSITLPALFVLAVLFFWRGMQIVVVRDDGPKGGNRFNLSGVWSPFGYFLLAGLLLGVTIYTYPPARILWLLFPLFLLFLLLFDRARFSRLWRGTTMMLVTAAVIALPLVLYLVTNPSAETRLAELSSPLQAATEGNLEPLKRNAVAGLKLLTFQGDNQWRYNIAGRPVLQPIVAVLFLSGLALGLWRIIVGIRNRRKIWPAACAFFAIVWLLLGLSPALVTGVELSTTRIVGLQPVLYLFPALAISAAMESLQLPRKVAYGLVVLLFVVIGLQTIRDYFFVWAESPEVRVQYETTIVTAINYLNDHDQGQGQAAISTTTPDRFHSPAVGLLTQNNPNIELRWFDGRYGLLIPRGEESAILFTGFSPLSPALEPYFTGAKVGELPLLASDLDQPLSIYDVDGRSLLTEWQSIFDQGVIIPNGALLPVLFGDAVELLGYDLQTPSASPGDQVRLVTLWRAHQPVDDAVIFVHLLGADGYPIAQEDRLDVPSYNWMAGDLFLQLHELTLPATLNQGEYPMALGVYTRQDLQRLPVHVAGQVTGDQIQLPPLKIGP